MTYFAPETEQLFVRVEQNIMSEVSPTSPNMGTEEWTEWD